MAGSLVTRWRTWRKERRDERRQEMLERLGLQIERGTPPFAGGYGFKLLAIALLVAVLVAMFYLMTRGSTRDPTSPGRAGKHILRGSASARVAVPTWYRTWYPTGMTSPDRA